MANMQCNKEIAHINECCDAGVIFFKNVTHIKHLLPHRGRVRRALIWQQPFGNCTGGWCLVILIKWTGKESDKMRDRAKDAWINKFKLLKDERSVGCRSVPPCNLQVQLHRPEIVDIHGKRLGKRAEQVEHFAGHAAHHHMIGQALKLRHLDNQNKQNQEMRTGWEHQRFTNWQLLWDG